MIDPALVSVIIPTYNSARYLPAALASVVAQDYRPLEVIVVDDGSTDNTADCVAEFFRHTGLPGEYVYQPNQGPAVARNRGLTVARGGWIAFLDADDLWLPDKTTRQMQVLSEYPQAGAAWGNASTFAGDLSPDASPAVRTSSPQPRYMLQSMLFRRTALDKVGCFDPKLRLGGDVDWLMRAMEQEVSLVIHWDLVVYYRRHAHNLTHDTYLTNHAVPGLLHLSLQRRRAQGQGAVDRPSSLLLRPRPPLAGAEA
jgi:glycosyltransferase involved in cell wall biosynthesis